MKVTKIGIRIEPPTFYVEYSKLNSDEFELHKISFSYAVVSEGLDKYVDKFIKTNTSWVGNKLITRDKIRDAFQQYMDHQDGLDLSKASARELSKAKSRMTESFSASQLKP